MPFPVPLYGSTSNKGLDLLIFRIGYTYRTATFLLLAWARQQVRTTDPRSTRVAFAIAGTLFVVIVGGLTLPRTWIEARHVVDSVGDSGIFAILGVLVAQSILGAGALFGWLSVRSVFGHDALDSPLRSLRVPSTLASRGILPAVLFLPALVAVLVTLLAASYVAALPGINTASILGSALILFLLMLSGGLIGIALGTQTSSAASSFLLYVTAIVSAAVVVVIVSGLTYQGPRVGAALGRLAPLADLGQSLVLRPLPWIVLGVSVCGMAFLLTLRCLRLFFDDTSRGTPIHHSRPRNVLISRARPLHSWGINAELLRHEAVALARRGVDLTIGTVAGLAFALVPALLLVTLRVSGVTIDTRIELSSATYFLTFALGIASMIHTEISCPPRKVLVLFKLSPGHWTTSYAVRATLIAAMTFATFALPTLFYAMLFRAPLLPLVLTSGLFATLFSLLASAALLRLGVWDGRKPRFSIAARTCYIAFVLLCSAGAGASFLATTAWSFWILPVMLPATLSLALLQLLSAARHRAAVGV